MWCIACSHVWGVQVLRHADCTFWQLFMCCERVIMLSKPFMLEFNKMPLKFRGIVLVFVQHNCGSLLPSNAVWRHRSRSTLTYVMACCLTAWSHLPEPMLTSHKPQWHSLEGNFTRYMSHQSLKWALKIADQYSKFHLDLPGANEFIYQQR